MSHVTYNYAQYIKADIVTLDGFADISVKFQNNEVKMV